MALNTATDNRRQARRFQALHPAQIVVGPEVMHSCTVRDISAGGARIAVKPHVDLPDTFELFIAAHELQIRRVRVCWRDGDCAGVTFDSDEDSAAPAKETPQPFPFEACLNRLQCQPISLHPQRAGDSNSTAPLFEWTARRFNRDLREVPS